MAIPFLGEIERLINEHGSAAILKERLALAADQYSALEKKVLQLEAENERLRLDLEECQKQRRALDEKLSHEKSPGSYKMKWGCLVFEEDETLYCPSCYFNKSKKIPTSRVDTHSRFCSVCKTKIPSG
jgi:hypothetical protein